MRVKLKTPFRIILGVTLPDHYTPGDVIADAFEQFGLPPADSDGRPIPYTVFHRNGNRILPVDKSLSESDVKDGDTLCLDYYSEVEHLLPDPEGAGQVASSGGEAAGDSITVVLSLLDLNRSEVVALPGNRPVGTIIHSVVADYGLPLSDKLGQRCKYRLNSKALGRFLMELETLAQAGVPVTDRLTLHREEEVAGGFGIPFRPARRGARDGRRLLARVRGAADRLKYIVGGVRHDPVDCTVYAPPSVPRGGTCLVQVFVYHPDEVLVIGGMAREFDRDATRRGFTSLEMKVARGAELTFHLSMPGLDIDAATWRMVWGGHGSAVQFGVKAPEGAALGDIVGTLRVSHELIPLGHIKFKLTVVESRQYAGPEPTGSGHAYRKAFVSYASEDRAEVMKRVQMLRLMRIKPFQDVLNLEPGSRWARALYRHIDESDLFLLFWSEAAGRSEWVLKEVRYALKRKGGDDFAPPEIWPIPIDGPPPAPAPRELAHLHFNDYYLYFKGGS